jgi:hypothetical protein
LQKTYSKTLDLTPEEQNIIALKYKGKRIEFMSPDELTKWTKALLLKINVITGWAVPDNDARYRVLLDQFQKQLSEKYFELNPDEIEFAFRNEGTLIEDWGKDMNLNLIDKILLKYLSNRYKVSSAEEQLMMEKNKGEFDLKTSVDWRAQVEDNFQHFIYGSKYFRREMHPFEYSQLEDDGFIQKGAYKARLKMYQKRLLHSDQRLTDMAKQRTVLQVFRLARKERYFNLYVKS